MTQPVQTIDVLLAEHAELELALADPALHSNPAEARRVGRRFARLAPIVATHRKLTSARDDLETARELVASDESFAAEVAALEARVGELDAQLTDMLAPRDPHDADDIVLEVKSGEGGEESALFAADLARMYIRYAERHGWAVTVLDETTSDLGGYKDATLAIASKADTPDGVWSRMKFEAGAPRTTGPSDGIPRPRAYFGGGCAGLSGARGSRPSADRRVGSAYRRFPVVRQGRAGSEYHRLRGAYHPSAHWNRRHLSERTVAAAEQDACVAGAGRSVAGNGRGAGAGRRVGDRASQIRTVDRSERIRTYNFPENRITDHRIGYKSHNLDQVLDGDLDALFDALSAADKQSRLRQS